MSLAQMVAHDQETIPHGEWQRRISALRNKAKGSDDMTDEERKEIEEMFNREHGPEASKEVQPVGLLGQPVTAFASGAVRGTDANSTRYDLISPHILTAMAEAYAEGAIKYGDDNWLKGIPSKDLLNHALRHIVLWQSGDNSEDHLGHAMWNIGAIIHFQKTRPDLIVRQYATA